MLKRCLLLFVLLTSFFAHAAWSAEITINAGQLELMKSASTATSASGYYIFFPNLVQNYIDITQAQNLKCKLDTRQVLVNANNVDDEKELLAILLLAISDDRPVRIDLRSNPLGILQIPCDLNYVILLPL